MGGLAWGAERCNSFSNFYLACLGQISWQAVPAIPPEIVRLPRWFYFHLDKVSAWSRTMILPLALVATLRPTRALPDGLGIDELFVDPAERHRLTLRSDTPAGWRFFFGTVDQAYAREQMSIRLVPSRPNKREQATDAGARRESRRLHQ